MLEIEHAGLSEQGPVRENNEDFITQAGLDSMEAELSKGQLFVIADGVGGNRAGEVASREAAQFLVKAYYAKNYKPARALKEAFNAANLHIFHLGEANPQYRRMETTLSALCLIGNEAHIGHIGDSRIYLVRDDTISQLTNDHSEVGELVRMRLISESDARHHPRRNVITRSIGSELIIKADFTSLPVQASDTFIMCSDGLWEPVEDEVIKEIASKYSPQEAAETLIKLALEANTHDNLSVQIIRVKNLPHELNPANGGRKNGLLRRAFGWYNSK